MKALTECPKCGKQVRSLEEHNTRYHQTEARLRCDQCEKVFLLPHQLRTHKASVHERQPRPCAVCGNAFKNLSWHMATAHGDANKRYPCEVAGCTRTFGTVKQRRGHAATVHEGVRFRCKNILSTGFRT